MKKIYIAAPLFNEMELERNRKLKRFLTEAGFDVYLPQEDGGICGDLVKSGYELSEAKKIIFERDVDALTNCDMIVALLDGRVPDEGVCVELGIAWAKNKPCVGYKTDIRTFGNQGENIMLDGSLIEVVSSMEELKAVIKNL